jgi:hypothetical protein
MPYRSLKALSNTSMNRRRLLQGAAILFVAPLCNVSSADSIVLDAQSSNSLRLDAMKRLPMASLTKEAQSKIHSVIDAATYFRRMPEKTIACDQELFKQFVRYPELLIGIWDAMGATKVQIERTAPFIFRADDAAGTRCVAELLYGDENIHIYYSTGDYTGKLFPKPIEGRSLCVVHSKKSQSADGEGQITAHFDVFLKLDSLGADLVVRTIGPLMGSTADQNYIETLKFLTQLSDASESNPFGVRSLVDRVRYVQPVVKEKFITEVYLAADRYAQRLAEKAIDAQELQR